MNRLSDWEARLHDFLEECSTAVFGYDHHLDATHFDCCMFAAGSVIAVTGEDPAAEFRGKYRSMAGASRALRTYGAGTLEATLDGKFAERPVAFARRGDLVMIDEMVGVCIGADALFIGEEDGVPGLVRFPRAAWLKAWSVG